MKKCIVCGGTDSAPAFPAILKCPECRTMTADISLSDKELSNLYSKNYFFGEEYSDYINDRNVLEKNFNLRVKVLERFLEGVHGKRLLEIGSAYGFFMDLVRNKFEAVQGFDISKNGVEYARERLKLDVRNDDFLKYDFDGECFDVVCLWDTLEHLRDPHLYLEKISRLVRKDGLVAITTGDIESVNARWRKEKWRLLHPPTHLYYFSKKSIDQLLKRYDLEVIYNKYCGFYRSIDNIAYNIFVLRNKKKFIYDCLKKSGLTQLCVYINLFDIFYIVARKK